MPEPKGNKACRKWDQECKRGCKNKRMSERIRLGKGAMKKKPQKQESAWSEDGGKKNECFDLVGRGDLVYCHVCMGRGDLV